MDEEESTVGLVIQCVLMVYLDLLVWTDTLNQKLYFCSVYYGYKSGCESVLGYTHLGNILS